MGQSYEITGWLQNGQMYHRITNVRVLGEKYRNHHTEVHQHFIDFKKESTVFDIET